MNQYRIRDTGKLVTESELRALFPDTSLPLPLSADALAFCGADPILESPAPAITVTQTAVRNGVSQDSAGNWVYAWTVQDMSADEIAAALATAKAAKADAIAQACAAQIIGGQVSNALGTAHTYPSKVTDQANLSASVLDSLLPSNSSNPAYATPFWCCDAGGNWAWVNHTAAQIQQVGLDVKAAILAAQSKNAQLQAQIAVATSLDHLSAIQW